MFPTVSLREKALYKIPRILIFGKSVQRQRKQKTRREFFLWRCVTIKSYFFSLYSIFLHVLLDQYGSIRINRDQYGLKWLRIWNKWLILLGCLCIRDAGVAGSNPVVPTTKSLEISGCYGGAPHPDFYLGSVFVSFLYTLSISCLLR